MRQYSVEAVKERLMDASGRQGFNQWMAPELVDGDDHGVELLLSVRPEMTQHHGFVHGGVIAALGDTACAWAGALASGRDVVTANYSIHFVAPAIGSRLRAVAKIIKSGRSMVIVEFKIHMESEGHAPKACAAGTASIAVLPDRADPKPKLSS